MSLTPLPQTLYFPLLKTVFNVKIIQIVITDQSKFDCSFSIIKQLLLFDLLLYIFNLNIILVFWFTAKYMLSKKSVLQF